MKEGPEQEEANYALKTNEHFFIHSFNESLLSIYCVLKGTLNAKNTVQLKTDLVPAFMELTGY